MLPIRLGGTLQWLYKGPKAFFTWIFICAVIGAMTAQGGGLCIGIFVGLFVGAYVALISSQAYNDGPDTVWFPGGQWKPYDSYREKPAPSEDAMRRDLVKTGN